VKRNSQSAFTLLEILLALALVALIATALIAGSVSLLSEKSVSADDVFWRAAGQARKAALQASSEVRLSFNDDQKAFIIDDGVTPRPLPVPGATKDLGVDFIAAQSNGADMMLVGGTLVDSQPMTSVTFYGDGTCSPFRVQIRKTGGAHIIAVDPWTCAQMLRPLPATP
jgi:prepilin-type N-terminal cleavage/methylation domain-containing protein